MNNLSPLKLRQFLPIGILLLVLFWDYFSYIRGSGPPTGSWIREAILAVAFILLIPVIRKVGWLADKNIINKLKALFVCVLGMYLSFLIPRIFFVPRPNFLKDAEISFASSNTFLYAALASILSTVFALALVLTLKDLIHYKRKRTTGRNFRILLFFVILLIVYNALKGQTLNFRVEFGAFGVPGEVILFIMIMFMVINSFRTSWVNCLNKRQKLAYFWGGLFLLPGTIVLIGSNYQGVVASYSIALGTFLRVTSLFVSVYVGMALLSILFHLPTASVFDRKMKEIASLHDLSRTISSVFDFNKLVIMITDLTSEVIEANYCWLEIRDIETGNFYIASAKNISPREKDEIQLNSRESVSQWVLENRQALLVNEISKDKRTKYLKRWKRNAGSLLAVPMLSVDKVLGIIYAIKTDEYGFELEDKDMLTAFANQAVVALENARLVQASIEKERLEQELKIAHDAQMKLLPKVMPRIQGLDIDATCVTANEVGGDYYDFFQFGNGKLGIVIGDVSGKGPEAAFYMAEVKGVIESLSKIYPSPKELLTQTNAVLFGKLDRKTFISLIYGIVDLNSKTLTFSRAGHCPLLYWNKDQNTCSFVEPEGIGIGLDRGEIFNQVIAEKQLMLNSGDLLLFYTDGVVEARNQNQQEFEEERLRKVVSELAHLTSTVFKERLVDEVKTFVGQAKTHDDLTLVVIKVV